MAALAELSSCSMMIKRNVGTLASGQTKVSTLTLAGANPNASASTVLDITDAIAAVIADPVLDTERKNIYRIYDDSE